MNYKDIILDRRTIHNYNNKLIDQSIIDDALECFLHAPNHRHTQPWNVIIASNEQRKLVYELSLELKSQKKDLNEIEKKAIQLKIMNPSHLIVILQKKCTDEFQKKEDYAAISCAIMNLQIYLWSQNIGCKWSSGGLTYHDKTYDIFKVPKAQFEIVGFNWTGYFDRKPNKPPKQSINDIIFKPANS